jgi:hypothetical protein
MIAIDVNVEAAGLMMMFIHLHALALQLCDRWSSRASGAARHT